MDIKHLRYFKTVADLNSFTKAAAQLHIAQPAISMAIQKLERELELTLFHRQERKISLTDEGSHLYQHACSILQATEDAHLEMSELKGLIKGNVRVGIPSMLGSYHFPSILMAFKESYPQLNLTIIDGGAGKLQALLEKGELDLAVIVDETAPERLETKVFLREQMMVVCPKEHPFANLDSISYPQLFSEPLAMFNKGYFHRNTVDRIAVESGHTPNISIETNLIPLLKSIVKKGFAISTLMAMVIEDEPELVARPFTKPVWLDLSIAWRKEGYLSQANQAFVNFLLKNSNDNSR